MAAREVHLTGGGSDDQPAPEPTAKARPVEHPTFDESASEPQAERSVASKPREHAAIDKRLDKDRRDRERERELTPHLAQERQRAQEQARREKEEERERRQGRDETPDEIRDDINLTRARMDRTIDTLQLRLNPQYLAQQTMDKIRYRSTRAGNRFTRLVRENPMPAILSALGLTWLIGAGMRSRQGYGYGDQGQRRHPHATPYDAELRARHALYEAGIESQGSAYPPPSEYETYGEATGDYGQQAREKASEYGEKAREKASEYGQQAREYGQQMREKASEYGQQAREMASDLGHRASEMGHQVREQASHAGERLRSGSHQASEKARDLFDQHPLSVGLGVMAAGLALGLLIPTTRKEDEIMGEQRDKLFRQAKEYGSDIAERGQAVVERATEAAKEAASEEGLTADQASEQGQDIASKARDVAAEAGQAARDEAQQQGLIDEESQQKRPDENQS